VRLQQDHSLTADQTKALVVADPEVLNSKIDNLINLNDLTEEAILHNLRIRFKVRARAAAAAFLCVGCRFCSNKQASRVRASPVLSGVQTSKELTGKISPHLHGAKFRACVWVCPFRLAPATHSCSPLPVGVVSLFALLALAAAAVSVVFLF
jgi:hypothetical protein